MPTLTITKTYDDGQVLNESDLDNIKNSIETFINTTKLDGDNLQLTTITSNLTAAQANNVASRMNATGANSILTASDSSHSIPTGSANKILSQTDSSHSIPAGSANKILSQADSSHSMTAGAANTIFNNMTRTATASTASSPNLAVASSSGVYQISTATGIFSTGNVTVTNQTISLTTQGKPVVVLVAPSSENIGLNNRGVGIDFSTTTVGQVEPGFSLGIKRGSTIIARWQYSGAIDVDSTLTDNQNFGIPGPTIDIVSAGTHTYSLIAGESYGGAVISLIEVKLVAYEL